MKICPECGKENRDKSFCTGCGFDITDIKPVAKVNVTVTNEATGKPVRNTSVTIRNDDVSLEGTTDIDGGCIIKNVSFGKCTISAKADGYIKGVDSVTIDEDDVFVEISIKEKKNKTKSKLKIIGVLIIIIAILCAGLYFVITNNNHVVQDSNSDNAVEQLISFDDSPKLKTVDFNGLFKMDVNESSTFHEVSPDTDWYVSKEWNNDINNTVYAFEGYNEVLYWKNTNLNEVVSNLSTIYHNPNYEGDLVILECYSKSSEPAYYDYLVGTQSDDNEVVLIMGSDLDLLKTYANSIVFE